MVGLCGTFGSNGSTIGPMADRLDRRTATHRFEYEGALLVAAGVTHHPTPQPVAVEGEDASILVSGEVYSRERAEGYERRPAGTSTCTYCARAFAEGGIEALTQLNGEFVCLVVEEEPGRVRIVTDRLGTRPIYRYADGETVHFSTSIQALAGHPPVETGFEPSYLAAYLRRKTVRGVRTPLAGIEQLPPASITTLEPGAGSTACERYWQPTYRSERRSFETFVDRFIDRFAAAIDDRIRSDRRHGLLLSGGSDSRLILAATEPARAYAFDDGSSDVETATRVARTTDVPFTRFDRGSDHYRRLLERNGREGNFVGWFNEGHAIGYETRLREEVDALVSGLYADVLFKGWTTTTRELPVPGVSIPLPIERPIESREAYLEIASGSEPPYLEDGVGCDRLHDRNLVETHEGIRDHGVDYPGIPAMVRCGFWYPLTNETSFDRYSDEQVLPTVHPFLDRRLVDLSLRMPRRYGLRYNVVDRALSCLAPKLASIPHSDTGVAPSRPRWAHRLGALRSTVGSATGGNAATLRGMEWIGGFLEEREAAIRALPRVDYDDAIETYREHMGGANHTGALCGLVTLLGMPITMALVGDGGVPTTVDPSATGGTLL